MRTDGVAIPDRPVPGVDARVAAALACIVPGPGGEACILLTERPDYEGFHAGEISFPGGRAEPGDAGDPVTTALREASEEIGLDAAAAGLEVIARLETVWIAPSNFLVTPIVAIASRPGNLAPDPREVAAILEPPLEAFFPAAAHAVVERTIRGWPLRYGAFPVEGRMVWGATAKMLAQLGELLARD